ncbi:MAG TPA: carboxypeptidase-like regulatory domain-containing protein [Thermoanaerobaculia bacterium]|nr:carboxypeptidase-like regulatory domain-containing protein [Thermoanaerobaculia bacterium]
MKSVMALFTACLMATTAAAATINGSVSDAGPATPLPSMTVSAYDAAGALRTSIVTDAQGRYTLTLEAGTYRVLAYDPNGVYATSFYENAESFDTSRQISVTSSQAVSSVDFALVRGGFIAGAVSDGSSPRAAITVAAYNLSGTLRGFTKSDASGAYRLVLPPAAYKVAAFDEARVYGTVFHHASASFDAATAAGVSAGNTTSIDFHIAAGGRIRGRVTARDSGTPLGDIVVTAWDSGGYRIAETTSAADGSYELFLPGGAYRVVFQDRSGTYASVYYADAESFDRSDAVDVAAGGSISGIDAALQRAGTLSGRVRNAETGAPLAGIVVAAYNASGTVRVRTTTDANGAHNLVVPPGSFKVGAHDVNAVYAPQFHAGQAAFAYAATIAVSTAAGAGGIDFDLHRAGRVSGTVVDRMTGAGIAGIAVAAYDLAGTRIASVRTATDGTYRIALAAGIYKLVAFDEALQYANAYLDGAANFDASPTLSIAAANERFGLNFAMDAGARVSGSATGVTDGAPVAETVVTAYDAAAMAVASATTGPDGAFAFAVPPGTYRFVASDPLRRFATSYYQNAASFEEARQMTLIAGGSTPAIVFRLNPAPPLPRRRSVRH